jgi:hypothetical protein
LKINNLLKLKMKRLLFALLFLPGILLAQEPEPLKFSEVIQIEGASSKNLHDRCLDWFAQAYNNSDEVLKSSSPDKLIAKPLIRYNPRIFSGSEQTKGTIDYTIMVQFKDGRYRYSVYDFYHEGNPRASFGAASIGLITTAAECPAEVKFSTRKYKNKVWTDIKTQIDENI